MNTPCAVLQPVVHWLRLSPLFLDGAELAGGKTARQGLSSSSPSGQPIEDHAESKVAEESTSTSILAMAAGFATTASGLSCCIAVAKRGHQSHEQAYLHTLIQPVWPRAAAASAIWQVTVLQFASQEGELHREGHLLFCEAADSAPELNRPAW